MEWSNKEYIHMSICWIFEKKLLDVFWSLINFRVLMIQYFWRIQNRWAFLFFLLVSFNLLQRLNEYGWLGLHRNSEKRNFMLLPTTFFPLCGKVRIAKQRLNKAELTLYWHYFSFTANTQTMLDVKQISNRPKTHKLDSFSWKKGWVKTGPIGNIKLLSGFYTQSDQTLVNLPMP